MPALNWDEGTAYGFFVSLYVFHRPAMFGARASWAAGVRSRLPTVQRAFLERAQSFLPVPLSWLYLLPAEAKNIAGALHTLAQLPAAERLPSLLIIVETPIEAITVLRDIPVRQTWSSAEQEILRAALARRGILPRPVALQHLHEAWFDLNASGELLLQCLTTILLAWRRRIRNRFLPCQCNFSQASASKKGKAKAIIFSIIFIQRISWN